jgi:hypothetical protein
MLVEGGAEGGGEERCQRCGCICDCIAPIASLRRQAQPRSHPRVVLAVGACTCARTHKCRWTYAGGGQLCYVSVSPPVGDTDILQSWPALQGRGLPDAGVRGVDEAAVLCCKSLQAVCACARTSCASSPRSTLAAAPDCDAFATCANTVADTFSKVSAVVYLLYKVSNESPLEN